MSCHHLFHFFFLKYNAVIYRENEGCNLCKNWTWKDYRQSKRRFIHSVFENVTWLLSRSRWIKLNKYLTPNLQVVDVDSWDLLTQTPVKPSTREAWIENVEERARITTSSRVLRYQWRSILCLRRLIMGYITSCNAKSKYIYKLLIQTPK